MSFTLVSTWSESKLLQLFLALTDLLSVLTSSTPFRSISLAVGSIDSLSSQRTRGVSRKLHPPSFSLVLNVGSVVPSARLFELLPETYDPFRYVRSELANGMYRLFSLLGDRSWLILGRSRAS